MVKGTRMTEETRAKVSAGMLRHGHARSGGFRTKTYYAWASMIQRCVNPKNARFADWGGRGITVCERWKTFENFLADMGACPPGLSLDRKDNNGNYEPDNCRWATRSEQQQNKRGDTI